MANRYRISATQAVCYAAKAAGLASISLLLSLSVAAAGPTTYKYDDLGRLVLVTHPNATVTGYGYDPADNRAYVASGGNITTGTLYVSSIANLRQVAEEAGYTGASAGNFNFIVPSMETVIGVSGVNQNAGIDTGTWPSGSNITLTIRGKVYGFGGNGGDGGTGANGNLGTPGGAGGHAIIVRHQSTTITIVSGGEVKGGGGGGAGGTATTHYSNSGYCGGGGGGGGFPNGTGGTGKYGTFGPGNAGGNGSLSGPGSPGTSCMGQAQGGAGGVAGGNGNPAASGTSAAPGTSGNSVKFIGVPINCPTGPGVAGPCGA